MSDSFGPDADGWTRPRAPCNDFKSSLWFTPLDLGLPGHLGGLGMTALAGLQRRCGAGNTARVVGKVEALHFAVDQALPFSRRDGVRSFSQLCFLWNCFLSALAPRPG